MRKILSSGSKWLWLFLLVLVGMLALGLAILPEVFRRGYAAPRTPAGLYILSLVTLGLFIGVIVTLAIERFERPLVILFIAFRIGAVAWEYQLGRHSLWYLAWSVLIHLLVGGLALIFLSHRPPKELPAGRDTRGEDDL